MTLYNAYRPKSFDEVVGQRHVVDTLRGAVKSGLIGHAYLLSGPRGTGKTTLARIFAHDINCVPREGFKPCEPNVCRQILAGESLDIVEMDAASHTGVDNIRQLKETIALPPVQAKFKVYIIDEAHMLSVGAWNALLKVLEEPPERTVFIFATTEVRKVPATILSRVQRFDLGRLSVEEIAGKLRKIAKKEKVSLDDEAAELLAVEAEGALRDAESSLAQIISAGQKRITAEKVRLLLGLVEDKAAVAFVRSLLESDLPTALALIKQTVDVGTEPKTFAKAVLTVLRRVLLLASGTENEELLRGTCSAAQLEELRFLAQTKPARIIEIIEVLSQAYERTLTWPLSELPLEIAAVRLIADTDKGRGGENNRTKQEKVSQIVEEVSANSPATDRTPDLARVVASWPKLIKEIKKTNAPLADLLSQSVPHSLSDGKLTLTVKNELFKNKLKESKTRLTLEKMFVKMLGVDIRIVPTVISEEKPSTSSLIAGAFEAMGGGRIVAES